MEFNEETTAGPLPAAAAGAGQTLTAPETPLSKYKNELDTNFNDLSRDLNKANLSPGEEQIKEKVDRVINKLGKERYDPLKQAIIKSPNDLYSHVIGEYLGEKPINTKKSGQQKIKSFLNNEKNFEKFKLSLLKKTKDYTVYQHCKKLSEILSK